MEGLRGGGLRAGGGGEEVGGGGGLGREGRRHFDGHSKNTPETFVRQNCYKPLQCSLTLLCRTCRRRHFDGKTLPRLLYVKTAISHSNAP